VQTVVPPANINLQLADGTAAAPSLNFANDTNTGIFRPTADTIAFTEGGAEAMRINSDGYVGINTTTPTARLDVSEANFANIPRSTRTSTSVTNVIISSARFKSATSQNMADGFGTTLQFAIQDDAAVENDIATLGAVRSGADNSGALTFATSNAGSSAERMRIDSSGNLLFNSGYGSVATAFGCRAWVNFNGTGTVAIRGSGNVSSITDGGTGLYTINYTTAMPDVNYSVVASGRTSSIFVAAAATISASSVFINTLDNSGIDNDPTHVFLAVFR
jgi:hypothetical protein